jgi:hypothetical protein
LGFLHEHLLHWLEVLSLLERLPEAVHALRSLVLMVRMCVMILLFQADPYYQNAGPNLAFSAFAYDARRFTMLNMSIVAQAPLQLYSSALVFAPSKSLVRQRLSHELLPWMRRLHESGEGWNANVFTVDVGGAVSALALSPDGKVLATGSTSTVRLLDSLTGASRSSLRTDGLGSISITYSLDGRLLAYSCYGNKRQIVGLWDTALQAVRGVHQFNANLSSTAVALSPDGELMAAAATSNTVQLYDTKAMELRCKIDVDPDLEMDEGLTVRNLVFSPIWNLLAMNE